MPLFTLQDLEQASPLFRGNMGRAVGRGVMNLLSINRLNALYDRHRHLQGADFAHSILQDLGIAYDVFAETPEVIQQLHALPHDAPFITICNHPYGGIDGVVLADYFGHLHADYKIVVNRILSRVESLSSSFIPVTPIGATRTAPTAESVLGIRHALEHLRSGGSLGLFPSGAVSDLNLSRHCVCDREWQLPILRFIAKAKVPILPIRFFGGNSQYYYLLGLIDWRVRLLRLPAEVFNKADKPIRLGMGPMISVSQQQEYIAAHTTKEFGQWLRSKVYGISFL